MSETMAPEPESAAPPPPPPPLALAIALALVTRYRLRLIDPRDARLGELAGGYPFGAAAWTGRRAAFVGFYRPPEDTAAATADLVARIAAARRWATGRLITQGAEQCDVLLIALGTVPKSPYPENDPEHVRVGAVAIDPTGAVTAQRQPPRGLPGVAELRHHVRELRAGRPAPSLAAVDLAERQSVAGGYASPTRRALVTRPVVTYGLIGLVVAVYLAEKLLIPRFNGGQINSTLGVIDLGAVCSGSVTPDCGATLGNWWRLVTSALLHDPSNVLHILGNGLALYFLGGLVEQLYGRLVLLGTFLVTAVLGDLFWMGLTAANFPTTSPAPGLGASGGILGLMGLLVMLGRVQGKEVPVGIASSIRQYAIAYSIFVIIFSFVGGVVANVNNFVHIGGFVAGVLLGLVVPPVEAIGGRRLHLVERAGLVVIIAAGVVAVGVGVHHVIGVLGQPSVDFGTG